MDIGESSFPRRQTRQVMVGDVPVGGGAPITVQSMTITKTADVEGTLQQIYALAAAGADIVRCTCNEIEAAEGLAQIVPRSPVPIVADIHHQYKMALAALDAGVHCLRLNPGNIRKPEHIKVVAQECKDRGIPIRIGVNGGSLDPALYEKHGGKVTPEAMVESAADRAGLLPRGRLRRREDLGEGVVGAADDRGLPAARRRRRPPAAPRRHRGRAAAGRPAQGHRRHGHAAGRGHRRHDPLQPHRRSGRGGAGRAPAARGAWACASARTSTSSPARAAGGPRST